MNRIWRRVVITTLIVTDRRVITLVAKLFSLKVETAFTTIIINILKAVAWFLARVLLGLSQEELNQMYEQVRRERQLMKERQNELERV